MEVCVWVRGVYLAELNNYFGISSSLHFFLSHSGDNLFVLFTFVWAFFTLLAFMLVSLRQPLIFFSIV